MKEIRDNTAANLAGGGTVLAVIAVSTLLAFLPELMYGKGTGAVIFIGLMVLGSAVLFGMYYRRTLEYDPDTGEITLHRPFCPALRFHVSELTDVQINNKLIHSRYGSSWHEELRFGYGRLTLRFDLGAPEPHVHDLYREESIGATEAKTDFLRFLDKYQKLPQ